MRLTEFTEQVQHSTAEILKQLQSISMKITQSDQVVQSMSMNMAQRDQVEEVKSNIDKLTAKIDKLGNDNKEMKTKMNELSLEFAGFKEEMRQKFEMMEKRLESFGEIVSSGKKTSENVKTALETLAEEVKKFKEDYAQFVESYHQSQNIKESNEYEFFKTVVEKLTALDGIDKEKIWREITKLREDFNGLKKLTESVWKMMQSSLSQGSKVGVNITDLEGGECKMDVEGRAVAVLTRWLSKRDSGLMWEDFISVVSEIDENVADTIAELRSSNP
ncbi:M protein, serotype 6-like [Ptychodera flava]|uniref:M protein, serotype 6-like n=1 Tax=Ptychodera flava TaxID=63121 RepID=UPI00396A3CD2